MESAEVPPPVNGKLPVNSVPFPPGRIDGLACLGSAMKGDTLLTAPKGDTPLTALLGGLISMAQSEK